MPHPLGPMMAVNDPRGIASETLSTASTSVAARAPRKRTRTSRNSIAGAPVTSGEAVVSVLATGLLLGSIPFVEVDGLVG